MILIPLGGQKWGRSFFRGGFVGAPDGQNSSVFVVSGANSSILYCLLLTNSLGKDENPLPRIDNMLHSLYDFDSLRTSQHLLLRHRLQIS